MGAYHGVNVTSYLLSEGMLSAVENLESRCIFVSLFPPSERSYEYLFFYSLSTIKYSNGNLVRMFNIISINVVHLILNQPL